MPTYDYECTNCKTQFEVFQNITDESLKSCPKCDNPAKRMISTGAGIIFKGNGFYQTDYKNSEKQPAPCCKSEKCAGCN
ncbi:MAG: FmdB family zinc ribbon protein [Candidatus Omnitrophota bacterium]|nr:zinc ribbon domain-containing protein [Candidatus Omnitrophota bacterium]